MNTEPLILYDGWLLQASGYGIAQHARRLLDLLQSGPLGRFVRVLTPQPVATGEAVPTIPLGSLPPWPGLWREVAWYARVSAYVRARHPEAVLILPAPGLMFRYPPKTWVICHDLIHREFPQYLGRWGYRKILMNRRDRCLAQARQIIADSVCTSQAIRTLLGGQTPNLSVIPLWAPPEFRADLSQEAGRQVRQRYGLPARYWLYIGGYDYRKNVEFLIRAYAQARRQGECPALVLAGEIPRRKHPAWCDIAGALAREGLDSPHILQPGFIPGDDLPAVYAAAELLVYPSRAEGFGLPPLEAMACGCPAVVSDRTSLPELVTDPAYRFNPDDLAGLTALLSRARTRPLPLNPGFDRTFYSADRALREYERVIQNLLNPSHDPTP